MKQEDTGKSDVQNDLESWDLEPLPDEELRQFDSDHDWWR